MIALVNWLLRNSLALLCTLAMVQSAASVQAQIANKNNGEKLLFPSMTCVGQPFACNLQPIPGWLYSPSGATSVVIINHGSQGLDQRIFEYVDVLNSEGMAALVLDHWLPRGFPDTHTNYARTEKLGGNQLSQAIDTVLAIDFLKLLKPQFKTFGSLGESLGGGTATQLAKTWIYPMINQQAGRLLARVVKSESPDAMVGMYGHCGHRSASTDKFVSKPVLLITGELDDETPSKFCEDYIPWMNARGGMGQVIVLPGVGHSFDAPYPRRRVMERHFAKCDFLVNGNQVTLTSTGETVAYTPSNYANLREKCSTVGFHTGYVGDRFIAVPHWSGFFKQHLSAPR